MSDYMRPLNSEGFPTGAGRPCLIRPDLNLKRLAIEIGVSHTHLSQILRGRRIPSLPVAMRLTEAFGLGSVEELVTKLELYAQQVEMFKEGKMSREEIWEENTQLK